jgi:hypothetical protein
MNFAGCGQCHEPEGKFPRARLGVMARDVTFEYFARQIYQHYERWPNGTMPLYSPERLPEVVLREVYTWLVDELGLRPWIAGSLAVGPRKGDHTSYTLLVSNTGVKDKGLAAEGLTVFVRIPSGCSVVAGAGTGYQGTMPLAKLGLQPALRTAPHPHDDRRGCLENLPNRGGRAVEPLAHSVGPGSQPGASGRLRGVDDSLDDARSPAGRQRSSHGLSRSADAGHRRP